MIGCTSTRLAVFSHQYQCWVEHYRGRSRARSAAKLSTIRIPVQPFCSKKACIRFLRLILW